MAQLRRETADGRPLAALVAGLDPARHVLIAGPTASGKSALALAVAQAQGGTIVNADALQVYGCWKILSARPGPGELSRAPHRLFGHVPRDAPYSVGHWLREVGELLDDGERLIFAGGTGLYFRALTEGLTEVPEIPREVRREADELLAREGLEAMVTELDAETRRRIDLANPVRVQRAWEVLRATCRGLAAWQDETGPPMLPLHKTEALVLEVPPERLSARIERRFDAMMAAGALEEVRAELPCWDPARPSSRAIGAAELVAHLRGEIPLEEAVERAKAATRQYAKRQRTWFRNRMKGWRKVALA